MPKLKQFLTGTIYGLLLSSHNPFLLSTAEFVLLSATVLSQNVLNSRKSILYFLLLFFEFSITNCFFRKVQVYRIGIMLKIVSGAVYLYSLGVRSDNKYVLKCLESLYIGLYVVGSCFYLHTFVACFVFIYFCVDYKNKKY